MRESEYGAPTCRDLEPNYFKIFNCDGGHWEKDTFVDNQGKVLLLKLTARVLELDSSSTTIPCLVKNPNWEMDYPYGETNGISNSYYGLQALVMSGNLENATARRTLSPNKKISVADFDILHALLKQVLI